MLLENSNYLRNKSIYYKFANYSKNTCKYIGNEKKMCKNGNRGDGGL